MDSFRQYIENILDDLFADLGKRKIIRQEAKSYPTTLELYRGFDADLDKIKQDAQYYYLSPEKAEQGQLWFTHQFIRHYDPIEYAKNHGQWFMKYELPVTRHVQIIHWDDGQTSTGLPDWWYDKVDQTRDGQFHAGIELPQGWIFSYKTEKFIGCRIKIRVTKQSIVPSASIGD